MTTDKNPNRSKVSVQEIQNCILTLEKLVENSAQLAQLSPQQRIALMTVSGQLSRPLRDEFRKRNKEEKALKKSAAIERERKARALTGIRAARQSAVFEAPAQITCSNHQQHLEPVTLKKPRTCYICKAGFSHLHFFYDSMCMSCADFNYQKRFQSAPLHGKVALITGSRLKIGYQAVLMMLRAGAKVIATTRFPVDSALRFSGEKDYSSWSDRLHIYGLDLRHTPSVELFCSYIEQTYERLDILISNAAQTVRRPPGFYSHLMENENRAIEDIPDNARSLLLHYDALKAKFLPSSKHDTINAESLPVSWDGKLPGIGISSSAKLSQIPYSYDTSLVSADVFPQGALDADLQQVDLRTSNSWRLRLGESEIQTVEMLEIQLVNAIAPFVMCNRLIPLMKRDNTGQKHIVNVSAMEGKFLRFKKGDRHPHTNMAKAALNMLTHTSASGLEKYGIFMNAVDTGWVTDEDPAVLAKHKQDVHDFQPPLDIVDGAARICDPFFDGILTGKHWCGKFLKDYFPIDW